MAFLTALICALSLAPAFAEPGEGSADPGKEDAGAGEGTGASAGESAAEYPELAPDRVTYAEGYAWKDVTPEALGLAPFVAVTAAPGWSVAVSEGGAIWRSREGQSWYQVLPAPGAMDLEDGALDDEALLLEAQALMEDFFDGEEDLSEDDDGEATATGVSQIDVLGVEGLVRGVGGEVVEARTLAWTDPRHPDRVLVAREDGLWRSVDAGRSWRRVDTGRGWRCFAAGPGDMLLAGTTAGLLYSLDAGRSWIDQSDALDDLEVVDLHRASGGWYAVSAGVVFTSADGQFWEALPLDAAVGSAEALIEDPSIDDAFWVAAGSELFRVDRGRAEEMTRFPLGALSRLRLVGPPGHLLWAGMDGVWESVDGGLTWRAVATGMADPRVYDLVMTDSGPVIATALGLLALLPTDQPGVGRQGTGVDEAAIAVNFADLVAIAMHRPGMDPFDYGVSARRTVTRRLLPEVTLRGQLDRDRQLFAYYTTYDPAGESQGINAGTAALDWGFQAQLRWGGASYSDGETSFSIDDVTGDLFVLGDTVYVDSGENTYAASAAANVTSASVTYRTNLADEMARLNTARQQLLLDREQVVFQDLRAQVQHELALQEINARIDAYTDGALSALLDGS